jgi:Asp-tRNA(Asn)/Glu-tRNA(Gln) amidotransferase A subunit family amidase
MWDAVERSKVEMNQNQRQTAETGEMTATEAAGHIKNGSLTAESYATALLRICKANRDLNALTWMSEEKLLESARRSDWLERAARHSGRSPEFLSW